MERSGDRGSVIKRHSLCQSAGRGILYPFPDCLIWAYLRRTLETSFIEGWKKLLWGDDRWVLAHLFKIPECGRSVFWDYYLGAITQNIAVICFSAGEVTDGQGEKVKTLHRWVDSSFLKRTLHWSFSVYFKLKKTACACLFLRLICFFLTLINYSFFPFLELEIPLPLSFILYFVQF